MLQPQSTALFVLLVVIFGGLMWSAIAARHTAFRVLAACLGFSAFFELIEWWAVLAYGAEADAFLATQSDPWDTQWDMFLCLCGAIAALLLLRRLHDRQLGPGIAAAAGGATP